MKFISKNRAIVAVGMGIGILIFALTLLLQQPQKISGSSKVLVGKEKVFTSKELSKYDGSNPALPIYLALDGNVYDVTAGKKFYATGGAYHSLAGRDSSVMLHLVGGDIIKKKYKVVGKLAGT